ncbi:MULTISPECIES: type II toxin-antitoxin system tRNA(fMet)-specific endonuclease VapC [Leptospira]|uniref:Type II toxin-antitoxin system VapC family toxin n=2 Tax=Leptospira TaxID=171 RepID=A0A6H3NN69_9LEPT|nr:MULTISPECIES: PIN domain-containing protein [Leptospira]MCG6146603.1 PIN domain-containing protein [Leptospira bandrabouensis]MCG6153114.1 PIN domain-containing protein [Leptospira bandrabouensis]MCG6161935.1 PIN domain-containing protein [Leptospira bandrabouensis]MCG6166184.1 PIN domain-containing protein [Leptospira bandrabouensis]TGK51132.1 type II toxin-antitoxin system VapC family toxin [Leptospira kanakyensis]
MFLLDTNICIFLIKKKNQILIDKINKNYNKGIFISTLTLAELEFGIQNSEQKEKNRISLIEFLTIFDVLPFEERDTQAFGIIKADLRKSGNLISSIDALLAAQAISRNLIFITNNTKEFKRVKNLIFEDWSQ